MDQVIKLKDGRKLGYAEYGDSKGKPLFFFHGWPTTRLHGKRFGEAAEKLGIRVISIDRPGFGLSDYQKDRTLLDWPDDIEELADQLGIKKFAIVGVSGGGPYAAVCAYKIPDRLTKVGIVVGLAPSYIRGLVGNDLAFLNRVGWANYHRIPILRNISAFLGWLEIKLIPQQLSFIYYPSKSDRLMLTKASKKLTYQGRKEAFKQGYKGVLQDLKIYTTNWNFDLSQIKIPVYLWYGSGDKNVSLNMGKYYYSQIPGSKLTIYPNEGHLLQVTHAQEILRTLTN